MPEALQIDGALNGLEKLNAVLGRTSSNANSASDSLINFSDKLLGMANLLASKINITATSSPGPAKQSGQAQGNSDKNISSTAIAENAIGSAIGTIVADKITGKMPSAALMGNLAKLAPIAAVVTGIHAVVGAYNSWDEKKRAEVRPLGEFTFERDKQLKEADRNFSAAMQPGENRGENIQKINSSYGGFLDQELSTNASNQEITQALEKVKEGLDKTLRAEAKDNARAQNADNIKGSKMDLFQSLARGEGADRERQYADDLSNEFTKLDNGGSGWDFLKGVVGNAGWGKKLTATTGAISYLWNQNKYENEEKKIDTRYGEAKQYTHPQLPNNVIHPDKTNVVRPDKSILQEFSTNETAPTSMNAPGQIGQAGQAENGSKVTLEKFCDSIEIHIDKPDEAGADQIAKIVEKAILQVFRKTINDGSDQQAALA